MIIIPNTKDKTKALIVGETANDERSISFLYDGNVCFGFWKLWHRTPETETIAKESEPIVTMLLEKIPNLTCVGWLSSPEGFVPKYPKTTIPPPKKEELTVDQKVNQVIVEPGLFNFLEGTGDNEK
jgi:hypothetical protein